MSSPGRRLVTLVAALLVLNASVAFRNVWPTPAVMWSGEWSVELAVCLLLMALAHKSSRPLSRVTLRWLTGIWLLLALGRYVVVTAPALWGRELNFYWDLRFLPDVAAMLAQATTPSVLIGATLVAGLAGAVLYGLVRWSFGCVNAALAVPDQRRLLTAVAAGAIAMFAGQRIVPSAPRVLAFATPVTESYATQVRFVIAAATRSRALPPSPSFASDLSRLGKADVLLLFVESYGAVAYERPEFNEPLTESRAALDAAIRAGGKAVVSAYVQSPTFGGSSWFAHITLLSGIDVGDPDTNALLMTEQRETLPIAFARQGYRTVALMPGIWSPWPEGSFYGFNEVYNGERLAYKGPQFGWFSLPDQYTLAALDHLEMIRAGREPLLVFFPTVSTHTPFSPRPPYQPDWPRMLTEHPYDASDRDLAYREVVDWMNLGPGYQKSVAYIYDTLGGYLARHEREDFVMIVLGDHQPPALVSGEGASWDVPVHVIANRPAILDRLRARGFRDGLTPARPSLGQMATLLPILLDAFGDPPR